MAAAQRCGYHWPTICGGLAECAACALEIVAGEHNASEISTRERAGLALLRVRQSSTGRTVRLACQLTFSGDAAVWKRGVRQSENVPVNEGHG